MKASEIVVFVLYLIFMLSIGVYFFVKNKSGGEKTYFLGGRQMGRGSRRSPPARPI